MIALVDARPRMELEAARRLLPLDLPADPEAARRLLAASWFVVRNDGGARRERARCERPNCRQVHDFVSWCCRKRPFRGLSAALYAVSEVRGERATGALVPGTEDLARNHPRTFGRRLPAGSRGRDVVSHKVGAIEPITRRQAETLTELIRQRDPSFDPLRE